MQNTKILSRLFTQKCAAHKTRTAYQILDKNNKYKKFTYDDIANISVRIAAFLKNKKIKPQEPVGIFAPNIPEWAAAFWGIILNNSTVIPVDINSGEAEIRHILQDTGIQCIFTTGKLYKKIKKHNLNQIILLDQSPEVQTLQRGAEKKNKTATLHTKTGRINNISCLKNILKNSHPVPKLPRAKENDTAVIIYTSGTTSQPKGVMLTHSNIIFDLTHLLQVLPVKNDDNFLSVISLSHTFELCCGLVMPLMAGAKVTYSKSLKYTVIFKNMQLAKPTIMLSVPMLFKILLENVVYKASGRRGLRINELIDKNNKTLIKKAVRLLGGKTKFYVSGGAPIDEEVIKGYMELGIEFLQGYGLTETTGISTITPPGYKKTGSVGKALPGVTVKIISRDKDKNGEVCIKGPNLMKGYKNNINGTNKIIKKDWLYSGDTGYMDRDGFLYITGRIKNLIVTSAGVNVYPEELEKRIIKSPFIKEACIIGKQRPDRSESIHAVIVPDEKKYKYFIKKEKKGRPEDTPGLNQKIQTEIETYTKDLARFKKIHDFHIRKRNLPRGRTKKIIRNYVKRESFSIEGRLGKLDHKNYTKPIALINVSAATPFRMAEKECIIIENKKITQMGKFDNVFLPPGAEVIDCKDKIAAPGFIDLHVHGGGGCFFNNGSQKDFDSITDFFISHGTTHMLATLYVDEKQKFLKTIRQTAAYCRKKRKHSVLHGMHLEGPFINKKMKGALNEKYIWDANIDNWLTLSEAGKDFIKLMTIAPELPGAHDVMQTAMQSGVVLGIAHSLARYENIEVAIDNGLSQITHIFNAMLPMHHREPGIITAALLKRELKVHLIADCIHVHPAVIELLYKMKGPSGIILITDAINAAGSRDGTYNMAGKKIKVKQGKATLTDNTLAGSVLTLDKAVKNLVKYAGIPAHEAIRMASLNPARVLKLEHKKGILATGKDADIIIMNRDFDVEMVIIDGVIAHSKP